MSDVAIKMLDTEVVLDVYPLLSEVEERDIRSTLQMPSLQSAGGSTRLSRNCYSHCDTRAWSLTI